MFVAARGVIYSAGFVFLWAWLAVSIRPYDALLPFIIPTWLQPVGLVISILGAFVAVWCIATFVTKGRGTPAPFDPPMEFVAVGPYRYLRNPMYLGGLCVIAGAGLVLTSPAIIVLALLFVLIAHLFVLVYEEPALERRFGSNYLNYKSSVPRWLPRLP
jgi:protein-S-isoprenylcysteine O-methyltransferase Ste14